MPSVFDTRTRLGGGVIGGAGAAFRRVKRGESEPDANVDKCAGSVLLRKRPALNAAGGESCGGEEFPHSPRLSEVSH